MDEKFDKIVKKEGVALPPRARSITELSPIVFGEQEDSSNKVFLMTKIAHQKSTNSSYFFKRHVKNSRLAELEAYCGAICGFLATSEYVPNTRPYFNKNGKFIGITSKAIIDFRSNYENPLQTRDLLINSPIIETEYKNRSSRLITQNLLEYYNEKLSTVQRFKRYASLNLDFFFGFDSPTDTSTQNALLQFINDPERFSVQSILVALKRRRDYLEYEARSSEFLTEHDLLNQVICELKAFNRRGSIDVPIEMSVELLEKFDGKIKAQCIDLETCDDYIDEEIDGIRYEIPVQDLKNYRIIRGLGVCLSTRYIFKEGDNHNSNMSKQGQLLDFGWTKANILFDFKKNDGFNWLLRNPNLSFACTKYNIEHFPDIKEPNLFYWPTIQPEVQEILLNNITQLLSEIQKELLENDTVLSIISAPLIVSILDTFKNIYPVNPTYSEIVSGFFHGISLQLDAFMSGQPLHKLIAKEKIKSLFEILNEKVSQLINLIDIEPLDVRIVGEKLDLLDDYISQLSAIYQGLRLILKAVPQGPLFKAKTGMNTPKKETIGSILQLSDEFFDDVKINLDTLTSDLKKRYEPFEHNAFTIEDNTNYKLLAGHPIFIFHKYKTFLKYILTDGEVYRIFAELNISKNHHSTLEGNDDDLHQALVNDEIERIQEIRSVLVEMPDFKMFLKEHGQFAFELIQEEFEISREKYINKISHQLYYQRLVQALDMEGVESKFKELCYECGVPWEEFNSQEDEDNSLISLWG